MCGEISEKLEAYKLIMCLGVKKSIQCVNQMIRVVKLMGNKSKVDYWESVLDNIVKFKV